MSRRGSCRRPGGAAFGLARRTQPTFSRSGINGRDHASILGAFSARTGFERNPALSANSSKHRAA